MNHARWFARLLLATMSILAGVVLWMHPLGAQTSQPTAPPTPGTNPRPTPPPPTPPSRPPTPMPGKTANPMEADHRVDLERAAEKRKQRLEEAGARADDLVRDARALSGRISQSGARTTYKDLGQQFLLVGTDLQQIVARLRLVYEEDELQDEQLRKDSERLKAMDDLLDAVIRAAKEAHRMTEPMGILARP